MARGIAKPDVSERPDACRVLDGAELANAVGAGSPEIGGVTVVLMTTRMRPANAPVPKDFA